MNSTLVTTSKRMPWLDACRGLAMIFVVYSHVDRKSTGIISLISPIMIPLFFVITGYLFSGGQKSPQEFLKKLLWYIVFPWLIFAYAQYIPGQLLTAGNLNLLQITWDIFSGEVLWYMPCCILAELLFYLLNRTILNFNCRIAVCCGLYIIGYILGYFRMGFVFVLNLVLISQLFLCFGQLLRKIETRFDSTPPRSRAFIIFALTIIYLALGIANTLLYPDSQLNMRLCIFNCMPLTLTMIVIGCTLVFMIFRSVSVPRWLCYIGQNTLVIYVLHGRFLEVFKALYLTLKLPTSNIVIASIIVTFLTCCCTAACAWLINRYLPFLVGKHKQA